MRRRMMVEKIVAILAAGGQMGVWDTALVYILHPVAFYDHPTTINATFATSVGRGVLMRGLVVANAQSLKLSLCIY